MKVLIPELVLNKIRLTCQVIEHVEWSGVLIYKSTGSIRNEGEYQIELLDIHLMDRGTPGFTSYTLDDSVGEAWMDAIMEFGQDVKLGHIHSHNKMKVFFSGTDMDELFDNCEHHNLYLSIIVNNNTDIIGKLVYRGIPSTEYTVKDENGEDYTLESPIVGSPILFSHDCEIISAIEIPTVEEKYLQRLKYINEKPKVVQTQSVQTVVHQDQKKTPTPNQQQINNNPGITNSNWGQEWGGHIQTQGTEKLKGGDDLVRFFKKEDLDNREIDISEDFACYLLRFGEKFPGDTIESACEVLNSEKISETELVSNILKNFGNYYTKYFKDLDFVDLENMEDLVDVVTEVISFYEELEGKFYFLPKLIAELHDFLVQLEIKWKEVAFGPGV